MTFAMAQRRAGAHDQELAQVTVAHLGDASEPWLAAGRALAWRQAEEGGELAPAGEGAGVLDRGHDRRGGDRADAGNGHQPLGRLVRLDRRRKLAVDRSDRLVERVYLTDQRTKRDAHAIGDDDLAILVETVGSHALQAIGMLRALRRDEADLGKMTAQSIERRRTLAGEQLARPMAHQRGLVLDRTHRHEPLARTTHRLVDRRCVNLVAFVAAHVGLHMRGRQQPNFMPELYQRPPPMMRRGARLHRHHAWRQRGEKPDELGARELARHHDLALRVDRVNLKYSLRQIQTNPSDRSKIPDRLAHGRLPFRWGFDNDHLGTLMPFGAPSTPSFADAVANGANRRKPVTQDAE